ncbi:uncharacterized protein DS421_4g124880 [Arachis hypogaea]|nr:uncharacterized protein DS421_4g124880 [Arachis hypogaea]
MQVLFRFTLHFLTNHSYTSRCLIVGCFLSFRTSLLSVHYRVAALFFRLLRQIWLSTRVLICQDPSCLLRAQYTTQGQPSALHTALTRTLSFFVNNMFLPNWIV